MGVDGDPRELDRYEKETGTDKKLPEVVSDGSFHNGEDLLALQDLDPALNAKMHLVNNVRDPESGLTLRRRAFALLLMNNPVECRPLTKLAGQITTGSSLC